MGTGSSYWNDLPLEVDEEEVAGHLVCFSTYDPGLRGAGCGLILDGVRKLLVPSTCYDTTVIDPAGAGHCSRRTESWGTATEIHARYREAAERHPGQHLADGLRAELRAIDRELGWRRHLPRRV